MPRSSLTSRSSLTTSSREVPGELHEQIQIRLGVVGPSRDGAEDADIDDPLPFEQREEVVSASREDGRADGWLRS